CATAAGSPKTLEAELIKKIITAVEPKSWSSAGGKGSIEYYPPGMALVVNQTAEVQTALARYLDSLRSLQDPLIATEVRLITVSDEWFEKSRLANEFSACKEGDTRAKLVSGEELKSLLRLVQDDPTACVMAAPKITTLNGQPGRIRVGQSETYITSVTVQ